MSGRPRIVDYELAKRLRDDGWTGEEVAAYFGVTAATIWRVTNPAIKKKYEARAKMWIEAQRKPCEGCGKAMVWTHTGRHDGSRRKWGVLCRRCVGLKQATTVRPDALLCGRCGEWKPDADFPKGQGIARRKRHTLCRVCQTEAKREYRWRYAVPCKACGGPRGADSSYRAPLSRERDTGLCLTCYRKSLRKAA